MTTQPTPGGVLVSDFDGTMTRQDFYKLALKHLLPFDCPDYLAQYREGKITHFEALRLYFAGIRADENEVQAIVDRMELDPDLAIAVKGLELRGWRVIVTSAGCSWYIRRLLSEAGVEIEVHANPGRFQPGLGLIMEPPLGSPHFSPVYGVSKASVVRRYQAEGRTVAFAGDGTPDAEAARLVPEAHRFARADLARVLSGEGLGFRPFERWSEVAHALTSMSVIP